MNETNKTDYNCEILFLIYLIVIGVIAYFVTSWVLLILLGGWKCEYFKGQK